MGPSASQATWLRRKGTIPASFLPLLRGTRTSLDRATVLEDAPVTVGALHIPAWQAVVTTSASELGRWEYIVYSDGERELYHLGDLPCYRWRHGLPEDPCMTDNLAGEAAYAGVEKALNDRLAELTCGDVPGFEAVRAFYEGDPRLCVNGKVHSYVQGAMQDVTI